MICPLHGFVWRKNMQSILSKYMLWSAYTPEEQGVMIAYASVYGNTENASEILACRLRDRGIKTVMFDVSVTPASEILAAAFKWSHLVFASTTYNGGIFVTMESLLSDLAAHNIQNRTIAVIENGSWGAVSGGLIREKLEKCKNVSFLDNMISIKSSLKTPQLSDIDSMTNALIESLSASPVKTTEKSLEDFAIANVIDPQTMFKLSYGLYVLSTKAGGKENGCIVNTVMQITADPVKISVAVYKENLTHDMILESKAFNVSVLTENTPFSIFEKFGLSSGKHSEKFAGYDDSMCTDNGVIYLEDYTNAVISAEVMDTYDFGTHTLFIANVTQAFKLSDVPSVTYQYYFDNIKPKPKLQKHAKEGYICKICGYIYEGASLPDDFICPLCKHGKVDFEKI